MRAHIETYEAVAERCDSFQEKSNTSDNSITNSTSDSRDISCTNCMHFTDDKYCELDLYDQILVNHKIEE